MLLAGGLAGEAAAQVASAAGQIRRLQVTDTVPVIGTRVLLHKVATAKQGPIDSTITDVRGHFQFHFRPDSGALYLVSARHDGIEYFSSPLAVAPGRSDTGIAVVVADSSSAATVDVAARHLVVTRPGDDGVRSVLDLTVLQNAGPRARIAPDTSRPSWSARLPTGTEALEVGEGDFSPDAVTRRGDSVLVFAPIAPGEKQLTIEYRLPGSRHAIGFGFDKRVRTVNLLIEEPGARVSGFTGAAVDIQTVEGRTFRRWSGSVVAGDTIRVDFGHQGWGEQWILAVLVGTMATVLVVAAWRYKVLTAMMLAILTVTVYRPVADRWVTIPIAAAVRRFYYLPFPAGFHFF